MLTTCEILGSHTQDIELDSRSLVIIILNIFFKKGRVCMCRWGGGRSRVGEKEREREMERILRRLFAWYKA